MGEKFGKVSFLNIKNISYHTPIHYKDNVRKKAILSKLIDYSLQYKDKLQNYYKEAKGTNFFNKIFSKSDYKTLDLFEAHQYQNIL